MHLPVTYRRFTTRGWVFLWVLAALGFCTSGWAEEPEDLLGRDTPRGAVEGFLRAVDESDLVRAAQFLDMRNLPPEITEYTPEQLANGLAIVLQRSTWIDLEQLSSDEEGEAGDGLPSYRDLLVELETRDHPVRVYLQRVPGDDDGQVWKFSNATIAELDVLYEEYRYTPYVEWLADRLPRWSFLGVELFKWLAIFSAMLLAAPVVLLLAWWLSRALIHTDKPMHANLKGFLLGPVSVFVIVVIGNQTFVSLGAGLAAQEYARGYTLLTAATVWLVWQSINLLRDLYGDSLRSQGRPSSIVLLRPLTSAGKTLVLLLGVLVWLDNLGFQITAVLTGLGIGGVAVALVLQKPLEDVFGAITLYTQQPIKIGDFGRFGAFTGTVEEISLRSTRIRTLDNSLVAVPNMRLASEPIENLSARQKFLYQPLLRLRNTTEADRLHRVLGEIRTLLADTDKVLNEGARVRFTSIGTVSHDFAVFAYVDAGDWPEYLEVAEALNFRILAILEDAGVSLALPLRDVVDVASA